MNNFLLGQVFDEHHKYPYGEDVSMVEKVLRPLMSFKGKADYKCFEIKSVNGVQHLQTSYYVGVDWIVEKELAIYVQPKLNKYSDYHQTNYLQMLFSALQYPDAGKHTFDLFEIKFNEPYIEISQKQDLLTPLLIVQFVQVVKEIVRKGLRKSYYKVDNNLVNKVRGKVLVGNTIKKNVFKNKPLNTFCSYDEFGVNGFENRLLKKALTFAEKYTAVLKAFKVEKFTSNNLSYIMPAFEFVSEEVNLNDIKHFKPNAFYKEYTEAIRLAKFILKRFGYNITNVNQEGKIKTPPFWIDMSKLFEIYVLGILKKSFGKDVLFQFQAHYGQPDYLLLNKQVIIDAKYKPYYDSKNFYLSESVVSDIRQISGYARDKEVLATLEATTSELQPRKIKQCLIIYPNYLSGDSECQTTIDLSKMEAIPQFEEFYKIPINLPVIPNT